MTLFGIELHTPTTKELFGALTQLVVATVAITLLVWIQMLNAETGLSILAGLAGGALASASGCTIQNNGPRALIVIGLFAVVLGFFCRVGIRVLH